METLSAISSAAVRAILRRGPMSPGKLRLAWRIAVGSSMDRATSVRLLDDGGIEVTAVDAAWRREVERSRAEILARLRSLCGDDGLKVLKVVAPPSPD